MAVKKKTVRKKKEGPKKGRPTEYLEKLDGQIYRLKLEGKSDRAVAKLWDISLSTLSLWKNIHPSFSEHYKNGLSDCETDRTHQVKNALLRRALGCTIKEVHEETLVSEGGESEVLKRKIVKKEVAPDTGACMAWLHNKAGGEFQPRRPVDESGNTANEDLAELLLDLSKNLPS